MTSIADEFRRWLESKFGELEPTCLAKVTEGGKGRARRLGEDRGQEDIQWTLGTNGRGVATAWDRPEIGTQLFASKDARSETAAEKRARIAQFEAEQAAAIEKGKEIAGKVLAAALSANADHPYLKAKKIGPEHLRLHDDHLIVEVRSPDGAVVSLQSIDAKGKKRFLAAAPLPQGHHALIPGARADRVALVEGWATGKSVSEALKGQVTVRCAMSAGNMANAARVASRDHQYRNAHFLVAADADAAGKAAGEAAFAVLKEAGRQVALAYPTFPHGVSGSDFNDLAVMVGIDEVVRQIEGANTVVSPADSFKPALSGICALLKSAPPDFVIPDLLPIGLTILAAPPKTGKSMVALQLGCAIASGGNFLGTVIAQPASVIYLALDNDANWRISARLLAMFSDDAKAMTKALDGRFFAYCGPWESGNYAALREVVSSAPGTKLLVIDVLLNVQRGKRKEENVYAYDYGVVGPITALANELGIAVVGITHTNKRQDVSSDLERVTGSMGVTAAGSSVWMLDRSKENSADRVLKIVGRDVAERELLLAFDPVTTTFSFRGDVADTLTPAELRVAELLVSKPLRFSELLAAAAPISEQRISELLKRLVEKDVITKERSLWRLVRALRRV